MSTTKGELFVAQSFKVINEETTWLRSEPIVIEATKINLLRTGQLVTKLPNTDKPFPACG
jgi:hypothetical protein